MANNNDENKNKTTEEVCRRVQGLISDSKAKHIADKWGLSIVNVAWEDTAREKNSSWGPCISDMTLQVGKYTMPLIRNPNFTDLTWDVPMENIPLVVGNENGDLSRVISLKQYLQNFRSYLHEPKRWKGQGNSLHAERDSHALASVQTCLLPVPKGVESEEFNVAIFNYQSTKRNPAVLAIVATSKGTSAQIVDTANDRAGQKLYFNKNGERCSFTAQRLSDNRIERGKRDDETPMSEEEKQDNVLMIIQVPLKHNTAVPKSLDLAWGQKFGYQQGGHILKSLGGGFRMEDAIIKVGKSDGSRFEEIQDLEIERDPNFPVRVTFQFYKATDSGEVTEEIMQTISKQMDGVRKNVDLKLVGSLVIATTNRPTEPKLDAKIPPWWSNYWLTYRNIFSQYSEEDARKKLFVGGRFSNSSMSEAHPQIKEILGSPQVASLKWGILE